MPRTKKQRRERVRLARKRDRGINPLSVAEALDSLEFSTVFRVQGGRRLLGAPAIAFDCNRRRVGKAIVPAILDIGRDKASKLMQRAEEAVAILARKETARAKRGNRQVRNVLEAFDSGVLQWVRYDADTNQQKSLLVGSSDLNRPPLNAGVNQIVCFRGDDYRFYVGEETFDDDSEATFTPLSQDGRPITYPSREVAERSILLACEQGEIERLTDRIVPDIHKRIGKKLRLWEKGESADATFEEYAPDLIVTDQRQRITTQNLAVRVCPKDGEGAFEAPRDAKQSLRVSSLVEIQLSQNSADSQ